jgi:hypothetical protein
LVDNNSKLVVKIDEMEAKSGIALSERTKHLIAKLFTKSEGVIIWDMLYRAVGQNINYCNPATPENMERIRFAILKLTKQSRLNLAVGIYQAQTDWRDLLMSAGFGHDANQHMAWYQEQMDSDDI